MTIQPMDWETHIGKPVRIYRNLQNHRMTIKAQVVNDQGKLQWRVVGHVTEAVIQSVTFYVSDASRARAIKERQRNVHAWGEGILLGWEDRSIDAPIGLTYHYQNYSTFVERHSEVPIHQCRYLIVRENKVWVSADGIQQPNSPIIIPMRASRKRKQTSKQVNLLELIDSRVAA